MSKDSSSGDGNATVIKPATNNTPASAATRIRTGPSLATDQARELTRIGKVIKDTDSSTGFDKARREANQALATNKILLNNRFVLDSILGGGGMGTVYKARDLRKVEADDVNPFVAIKVLNEDFQHHPDAFVTLQREASKSTTLAHPHIVTVHDFDRDGAVIFMTMELLQGKDLEKILHDAQGKALPPATALKIINDYCAALIYAHQKNIIHSDLKPGNIFMTQDGAKVLDFGIARLAAGTKTQDKFDAGQLGALTPAYASLEMLRGEPADPRDDVYAAAVIAYELLAGVHPYARKPADEALALNLKPARIAGIATRQWQALERGLRLERQQRTATVAAFIQGLTKSNRKLHFAIAAVLLISVTAVFMYAKFFVKDNLQQVIVKTLEKGQQCLAAYDYACAVNSANTVLQLDKNNAKASSMLSLAKSRFSDAESNRISAAIQQCLSTADIDCARTNLANMKIAVPGDSKLGELQQYIDAKVAYLDAKNCLDSNDLDCASSAISQALTKNPGDNISAQLRDRIQALVSQQRAKTQITEAAYRENLQKGNQCFGRHDYECSIATARQALLAKPGDGAAEALLQKASFAQMQLQEASSKANIFLQQGLECYKKKNYSCAIAKSESALEFVPDNKEAMQLKKEAQQEQTRVKNSINIQ